MIHPTLDSYGEYFTVDTDDYVRNALGEPDDALTESLSDYAGRDLESWRVITAWLESIREDGESEWSGLYGDGEPWHVWSGRDQNVLADEISVVYAVSNLRTIVLVADDNGYGAGCHAVYLDPDTECAPFDWSRLHGRCTAGHHSVSEDGGYRWSHDSGDGVRWFAPTDVHLDSMVRTYDPDDVDADMRYVECPAPACYHALTVAIY